MKTSILLAPLAAVAAGALFVANADAVIFCKDGVFSPLPGTPKAVKCTTSSGVTQALGNVGGDQANKRVSAALSSGTQLDVAGLNQNGSLLRIGCAIRTVTPNSKTVFSNNNTCAPDDPNESFAGISYSLYR